MANLTPEQIEAARRRGADVVVNPKVVDVPGLGSLVAQLKEMVVSNSKAQVVVLAALREMTDTIRAKKIQGTDVTKIVTALEELKTCYEPPCYMDYVVDFERDQRGLMLSGVRLRAVASEQ